MNTFGVLDIKLHDSELAHAPLMVPGDRACLQPRWVELAHAFFLLLRRKRGCTDPSVWIGEYDIVVGKDVVSSYLEHKL